MFSDKHGKVDHILSGKLGEDLACRIIAELGYIIVRRNYRTKYGEIDVISTNDNELVFIEVKTLINKNVYQITPEDNLTKQKLLKLKKICLSFANENEDLFDTRKGWRIDLLVLSLENGVCRYKHYKNIG